MLEESNPEVSPNPKVLTANESPTSIPQATRKSIVFAIIVVLLTGMAIASIILATDIILILFLGLLFGIFLHHFSKLIASWVSIPQSWSLGVVTLLFLTLIGGGVGLFGLQISQQIVSASEKLDEGAEQLLDYAGQNPTLNSILTSTPYVKDLLVSVAEEDLRGQFDSNPDTDLSKQDTSNGSESNASDFESTEGETNTEDSAPSLQPVKTAASRAASMVGKVFSTTLGLVINSLLIFFVGLFLASNPEIYRDGVVKLFPLERRKRVREIMNNMGGTMWSWLLGRFGSMLITGVGAAIILWLLGVPMAISLGIMTGLLAFIPNIGGAIAFLLAFLVAMSQGFETALWLIPAYLALQLVESYVATPLIQQNQVAIPPALLIAFQAVFGVIFGLLGAAVASPLLAAVKVGIEEAYIKDVLGDEGLTDD